MFACVCWHGRKRRDECHEHSCMHPYHSTHTQQCVRGRRLCKAMQGSFAEMLGSFVEYGHTCVYAQGQTAICCRTELLECWDLLHNIDTHVSMRAGHGSLFLRQRGIATMVSFDGIFRYLSSVPACYDCECLYIESGM